MRLLENPLVEILILLAFEERPHQKTARSSTKLKGGISIEERIDILEHVVSGSSLPLLLSKGRFL